MTSNRSNNKRKAEETEYNANKYPKYNDGAQRLLKSTENQPFIQSLPAQFQQQQIGTETENTQFKQNAITIQPTNPTVPVIVQQRVSKLTPEYSVVATKTVSVYL